jgi:hypothetical protein
MTLWKRLLREPLLHFVAIGGLIFALYAALQEPAPTPANEIVITPQRIEQIATAFEAAWKRPPSAKEIDGLIEQDIREEVYYREAVTLGLDRNDEPVRRRMRMKMEFLMDNSAQLLQPAAGGLERFIADHADDYQHPPRLAFEQVYLGERPATERVSKLLDKLRASPDAVPDDIGTRSLLPPSMGLSGPQSVDGLFGSGFFERIAQLPTGTWSGPVESGYGAHLIRITRTAPAYTPPLEQIRAAVLRDWRSDKAQLIRDQDYAQRREGYVITIQRDVAGSN